MSYKARRLAEAPVDVFRWEQVGARAPGTPPAPSAPESAEIQTRLAALERDAFAKGYAQGERAGTEAAATRADGMLRRLTQTVEELGALRGEIIRRTERQTVQLVLAIAERIVAREVSLDRSLLIGMARAALDRLGEYGSATIRLHPEDFKATRGGCLVQSDFGFMDVSPDSQFRELARTLLSDADAAPADAELTHGIVLK
jgi:flagellar biosynthesis/type III secretory pathway protein FliH